MRDVGHSNRRKFLADVAVERAAAARAGADTQEWDAILAAGRELGYPVPTTAGPGGSSTGSSSEETDGGSSTSTDDHHSASDFHSSTPSSPPSAVAHRRVPSGESSAVSRTRRLTEPPGPSLHAGAGGPGAVYRSASTTAIHSKPSSPPPPLSPPSSTGGRRADEPEDLFVSATSTTLPPVESMRLKGGLTSRFDRALRPLAHVLDDPSLLDTLLERLYLLLARVSKPEALARFEEEDVRLSSPGYACVAAGDCVVGSFAQATTHDLQ